jgi:hypothetical protein
MKHILLTALLIGAFGATAQAQDPAGEREDRIAAYRVAVFTRVLKLTGAEAEGFWPVYNEHQAKKEELQKKQKPSKQIDAMTDAEVEEYLKQFFENRQRELDLEKETAQKLRKVLPIRKIAKLPVAEREFREELVQRLKEARERREESKEKREERRDLKQGLNKKD